MLITTEHGQHIRFSACNKYSSFSYILGVGGLPFKKVEIVSTDPLANVIELGSAQSGILIFGIGGGADLYPGVYSISRAGHVNTILEAKSVTSVTSTGSEITVTKAVQNRATALWIKVQS